jgi:YbgC/YbaW family acyl-CoA thioester hydrolase
MTSTDDDPGRATFEDRVRLYHTDAFGVQYWGSAFDWAQRGIETIFERAGHPIQDGLATQIDYPIRHAAVDFVAPLSLGTHLVIDTVIAKVGRSSVTAETRVRADGQVAVTVTQVLVAYSRADQCVVPVEDWLRALARDTDAEVVDAPA